MVKCPLVLYAKPSNKRFIIPLQKNCYFAIGFYFFGKNIEKHPDSVCENDVNMMNKMFAGIICQTIEREIDYSTAKKKLLFWLLFSIVNLFSTVKIRFISRFVQFSHNCSFIRRYSPCCKPVKLGHYSVY